MGSKEIMSEKEKVCDDDSEDKEDDDMDQRGVDGDDEREESTENSVQSENVSNAEHAHVNVISGNELIEDNEQEHDEEEDVEHFKQWIPLADDEYITFRREEEEEDDDDMDGNNLMYIDSFLQSISVSNQRIDANDISIDIEEDGDEDMNDCNIKQIGSINRDDDDDLDEQLEQFRRRDLNDYLVQDKRRTGDRKKDWWMKYLNQS